jgi:pyrroloquinoline quinone (PQQ) biosynthesis protein C
MPFYEQLAAATSGARSRLVGIPIIQRALAGEVCREEYLAFLAQAYHHVKHTVPLLMACGARLPERLAWLREAVARYIEEELGHEDWILDDIAAAGGDPEAVRRSPPSAETELMVAYAYDTIQRRNPAGFFGMVYVLEGTSVSLAHRAAGAIQGRLGLPDGAFRYLNSHGSVDQEHLRFLEDLVNRLEDPDDRDTVLRSAGMFFRLYGDIFRSLSIHTVQ